MTPEETDPVELHARYCHWFHQIVELPADDGHGIVMGYSLHRPELGSTGYKVHGRGAGPYYLIYGMTYEGVRKTGWWASKKIKKVGED